MITDIRWRSRVCRIVWVLLVWELVVLALAGYFYVTATLYLEASTVTAGVPDLSDGPQQLWVDVEFTNHGQRAAIIESVALHLRGVGSVPSHVITGSVMSARAGEESWVIPAGAIGRRRMLFTWDEDHGAPSVAVARLGPSVVRASVVITLAKVYGYDGQLRLPGVTATMEDGVVETITARPSRDQYMRSGTERGREIVERLTVNPEQLISRVVTPIAAHPDESIHDNRLDQSAARADSVNAL